MRKNIIIIAVVAALLIGLGYFALFSTPAQENSEQLARDLEEFSVESKDKDSKSEKVSKGTDSLKNLMLLNQDLECSIVYDPGNSTEKVEGTYFTSEGKMRGDFLTDSPDMTEQVLSSMIIDGDMTYIWSEIDGGTYGIKMDTSIVKQDSTVETNEPVSIDENVDFDCKSWKAVDNTVFTPPASVLFQDMSQIMKSGMEYGNIYEEGGEMPF